jgi:23S rRNA pseudouridine1911/1915/1917 synthase
MQTLEILYSDPQITAIAKPAGLATVPGRGETDSAIESLARQLNLPHTGRIDPRVRPVHRLDKETSGVLLFALTVPAQRHLSHQFQNNNVRKEYLALVHGQPADDAGTIDAPLAPHSANPRRMTVFKHGRPAQTQWQVEERFRLFTLLRVFPRTGKTHQIRVHLKHIGLPLAVDLLYAPPPRGSETGLFLSQFKRGYRAKSGRPERPLIGRLTLHAQRLTFTHPDGQILTVEAPLSKDFQASLNQLRRHGR